MADAIARGGVSRTLFSMIAFGFSMSAALAEDFYAGKTISIIVSGGGLYEGYARTMARHMPKHIPGRPAVIVQQMTGGGGLRAANFIAKRAPRDGTMIAGTHGAVLTSALLAPEVTDFDVTKFNWLGNVTSDTYLAYVRSDAPVQKFTDTRTTQLIVGGTSIGGAGIDLGIIAKDLFGYNLKIVSGYKTSPDAKLAMERGEIQGTMGNAISSLRSTDWLETGKVRVLLQLGSKPHRDFPNVPLYNSITSNESERQLLDIISVRNEIAKPYFTPPDVPADRVAILRRAFDATIMDPEFVAEAEKQHMEIDSPLNGAELAAIVNRVAATPPSVVARLVDLFKHYKDQN